MRFLCLHGQGTNSEIFEFQTAALRHELGDEHEFHFIEGAVPCPPAPGLASLSATDAEYFSWIDVTQPAGQLATSAASGFSELDAYLCPPPQPGAGAGRDGGEEVLSFDAVLGFSQGAAIAATYMLHRARVDPAGQRVRPVFRAALFFSALPPADLDALGEGRGWIPLEARAEGGGGKGEGGGSVIGIPTVHVYAADDPVVPGAGKGLASLCARGLRETVVHPGGHEVPGGRDAMVLGKVVRAVRRMVEKAGMGL